MTYTPCRYGNKTVLKVTKRSA